MAKKTIWEKIKDFSQAITMGRPLVNPQTEDPKPQDSKSKVQVGFQPPEDPLTKGEMIFKKVDTFFQWVEKKLFPLILKVVIRLTIGAIIWFLVGYFVPPIREVLPNFYKIVDGILWCYDGFIGWAFSTIGAIFGSFGG